MRGVRPNSPATTTSVLSSKPRSSRSMSSAESASSSRGRHQPMPYEPVPKALPIPISPPCMSQLETGGGPPSSSWDMHGGEMGMGNAFGTGSYGMGWCLPRLDDALSALLIDLEERGLLESTLVVVAGEFGRTPRINQQGANPGRQHWPSCYSAILAGGGIRGGAVYGESDQIGAYVKDKPVRPQDLGATVFHSLGVPLDLRLGKDGFTRPISSGQPILELFG